MVVAYHFVCDVLSLVTEEWQRKMGIFAKDLE